jgi:hypothetical protein
MKRYCFVSCFSLLLIVCFSLTAAGCYGKGKEIRFDDSEPLALAPDISWAVVVTPYAAYRKKTSWQSDVSGHCRKGDILQVTGKTVVNGTDEKETESWYDFAGGWLPASAVNIYNNQLRAERAAAHLK